jgi:hypothetical protein
MQLKRQDYLTHYFYYYKNWYVKKKDCEAEIYHQSTFPFFSILYDTASQQEFWQCSALHKSLPFNKNVTKQI